MRDALLSGIYPDEDSVVELVRRLEEGAGGHEKVVEVGLSDFGRRGFGLVCCL